MQQMLNQLNREHRQIEKLLDSLDQIHIQTGAPTQNILRTMLNKLGELQHEQVQDHHDLEDKALDLLKSRYRVSDIMIGVIERDHTRLDSATVNATDVLEQALNDPADCPMQVINKRMAEFTQAYRNHIRTEEDVIFPMIEQLIAEEAVESKGSWSAQSA